jgi:hypothetical protein
MQWEKTNACVRMRSGDAHLEHFVVRMRQLLRRCSRDLPRLDIVLVDRPQLLQQRLVDERVVYGLEDGVRRDRLKRLKRQRVRRAVGAEQRRTQLRVVTGAVHAAPDRR